MTSSSTLAARVADYFFVAGLHDNHVMPAYEAAKKNQKTSDDDNEYYQQQAKAVATNGASNSTVTLSESPPTMSIEEIRRRRGYSVSALSTNNKRYSKTIFPDIPENTASLLGVLDHVQHVIDNFDKDRDTARDSVIAVHDPAQITRHDSDKTIQLPLKSSHSENTSRKSSFDSTSRRWRRPSDPKLGNLQVFLH
jgi:hypothetical protein